jgi:hypothetical protein
MPRTRAHSGLELKTMAVCVPPVPTFAPVGEDRPLGTMAQDPGGSEGSDVPVNSPPGTVVLTRHERVAEFPSLAPLAPYHAGTGTSRTIWFAPCPRARGPGRRPSA